MAAAKKKKKKKKKAGAKPPAGTRRGTAGPAAGAAAPPRHRVFGMAFAKVYPLLVQKAERKQRTRQEVDQIICWLTGYTPAGLHRQIEAGHDIETFFAQSPAYNPAATLITGKVCGVQVEAVEDPLMRRIRQLDKLIDELAQGRSMERILRKGG